MRADDDHARAGIGGGGHETVGRMPDLDQPERTSIDLAGCSGQALEPLGDRR